MKLRFQFGLRALLTLMLLVATFLGGIRLGERRERTRRDQQEQARRDREKAEFDERVARFINLEIKAMNQRVKPDANDAAIRRFIEQTMLIEPAAKPSNGLPASEPKVVPQKGRPIEGTFDKVDSPRSLPNPPT